MLSLSGLTNPNPQVRIGPAQTSCMLGLGLRLACTWNHSHGGLLGGFALVFLRSCTCKTRGEITCCLLVNNCRSNRTHAPITKTARSHLRETPYRRLAGE